MLVIDVWPQLRDPVVVLAFSGWVDAGESGTLAASTVAAALEGGRIFGRYELADLVDLSQTRPRVDLEDGAMRRITWPVIELSAGRIGRRDVVVCAGPEPSLRWPSIAGELVEAFVRLGTTYACTLAGVPGVVSHRDPVPVTTTAASREHAEQVATSRRDYHGPVGFATVLQTMIGDAGIPSVGLWARVPHYVAANPSPTAVRALLTRVEELTGVAVEIPGLDDQVESYLATIEEGLAERPDVAELVQAIETEARETGDAAAVSGDEIAAEIERFLREQQ